MAEHASVTSTIPIGFHKQKNQWIENKLNAFLPKLEGMCQVWVYIILLISDTYLGDKLCMQFS